ncbi:MAG: acetate--CoA ligase family protein, partial [Pseudomonadota bacterium]
GACVLAAAKAEAAGVALPEPKEETRARLRAVLPDFVPAQNPCDATAMVLARRESFEECMQAFLDDPDFAAGIIAFPAYSVGGTEARIDFIGEVAARNPERVMAIVWMVEWPEAPPAVMAEKHPNLALFRSMRQCMTALRAWQDRDGGEAPARLTAQDGTPAEGPLDEWGAKRVLAARGIGVTREDRARTAEEAVEIAGRIGGAVAMKVSSAAIQHKTEIGGVRLGLSEPEEIRATFEELKAATLRAAPDAPFEGVLVQEMLPPGVEMIVGGFVDPVFGPVVSVGAGGVLTEVLGDVALALAPVSVAKAREMIDGLRGRRMLDGFRGAPAADADAVAEAVARASELLADGADWIAELDINPLIAGPEGAVAADALIVRKES